MHHQHRLLIDVLDRNEPHQRSRHRLADRCSIRRIVLVALDVGLHVGRRHQLDLVAQYESSRAQWCAVAQASMPTNTALER